VKIDLSPYAVRALLNWWVSGRGGFLGSLGAGLGALRDISLADRLAALLEPEDAARGECMGAPGR